MNVARRLVRTGARWSEDARSRIALREAARIGRDVRVFGKPDIVCSGTLVLGDRVVIVACPAAVTIIVDRGGTLEIGDDALIESGAVLRAHRRVVVAPGAHVEAGAIIDDTALADDELRVGGRAAVLAHANVGVEHIRAVIATIVPAVRDVRPAEDVRRATGWDSLAALHVVVALEKELGVRLPHDLFAKTRTLESLEAIVRRGAAP